MKSFVILLTLLICANITSVLACSQGKGKKRSTSKVDHRTQSKGKSSQQISSQPVLKQVPINGYIGIYNAEKHSVEIDVGDIAVTGKIVDYCQGVAVQTFKQYSSCSTCKINWQVVGLGEIVISYFVFKRTSTGAQRVI